MALDLARPATTRFSLGLMPGKVQFLFIGIPLTEFSQIIPRACHGFDFWHAAS
jgi:hypothetical protein